MHSSLFLLKKPKASVHYNLHSKPSVESNTSSHSIMFPTNHQRFENWFQVSHSYLDERLSLVPERMQWFFAETQACLFILLDSYNLLMPLNDTYRCMHDWCIKSLFPSSTDDNVCFRCGWLTSNQFSNSSSLVIGWKYDWSRWPIQQRLYPNVILFIVI